MLPQQGHEGHWVEYIHQAKGYFIHNNEEIIIEVKIISFQIHRLVIHLRYIPGKRQVVQVQAFRNAKAQINQSQNS